MNDIKSEKMNPVYQSNQMTTHTLLGVTLTSALRFGPECVIGAQRRRRDDSQP